MHPIDPNALLEVMGKEGDTYMIHKYCVGVCCLWHIPATQCIFIEVSVESIGSHQTRLAIARLGAHVISSELIKVLLVNLFSARHTIPSLLSICIFH